MPHEVTLDGVYAPSENVVFREIEGEPIIVPLTSGIGDIEDALFTMNETGKVIWSKLDGKRSLNDIVEALSMQFDSSPDQLREDVTGFMSELLKRDIVVERSASPD